MTDMQSVARWFKNACESEKDLDIVTVHALFNACIDSDELETARALYDQLMNVWRQSTGDVEAPLPNLSPNVSTFIIMINAYLRKGDIDMAFKIFADFHERYPVDPDANYTRREIFGTKVAISPMLALHHLLFQGLLEQSEPHVSYERVDRVFKSLLSRDIVPIPKTVPIVAESYEAAGATYPKVRAAAEAINARRMDQYSAYYIERRGKPPFAMKVGMQDPRTLAAFERAKRGLNRIKSSSLAVVIRKPNDEIVVEDFFDLADAAHKR